MSETTPTLHAHFYQNFYRPTEQDLRPRVGKDVVFEEAKAKFVKEYKFALPMEWPGFKKWYYAHRKQVTGQTALN